VRAHTDSRLRLTHRRIDSVVLERPVPRAGAGEHERFVVKLRALVAQARASGVPASSLQTALRKAAEEVP
jgi:hypothetical protein